MENYVDMLYDRIGRVEQDLTNRLNEAATEGLGSIGGMDLGGLLG